MVPCCSGDTRATWGSIDPDMVADQAHLPMPTICVDFRQGQGWGYYNNQRNPNRHSCCCCCCCISDCRLCSNTVMSFTIAGFLGITLHKQTKMWSLIPRPILSKHWVVIIQSSALSGRVRPVSIPRSGNVRLFPKICFQRFFLKSCCKDCFDALEGVKWFRFKNKTRSSNKIRSFR
jgi:hypothetical protein